MSKRVLNTPRNLSENELIQLEKAKSKWYPKLIQTYNTTLIEMMASPYKKALLIVLVFSIIFAIVCIIDKQLKLNIMFIKNKINKLILVVFIVFIIFVAVTNVISQYRLNDDLTLFLTITKPNATKFDYESSNVIQSKLMRNAYKNGSRSAGDGILGGLIGSGIGYKMGKRR